MIKLIKAFFESFLKQNRTQVHNHRKENQKPSGITGLTEGGSCRLMWNEVPGAKSYWWQITRDGKTCATCLKADKPMSDFGLLIEMGLIEDEVVYVFEVRAVNQSGEGEILSANIKLKEGIVLIMNEPLPVPPPEPPPQPQPQPSDPVIKKVTGLDILGDKFVWKAPPGSQDPTFTVFYKDDVGKPKLVYNSSVVDEYLKTNVIVDKIGPYISYLAQVTVNVDGTIETPDLLTFHMVGKEIIKGEAPPKPEAPKPEKIPPPEPVPAPIEKPAEPPITRKEFVTRQEFDELRESLAGKADKAELGRLERSLAQKITDGNDAVRNEMKEGFNNLSNAITRRANETSKSESPNNPTKPAPTGSPTPTNSADNSWNWGRTIGIAIAILLLVIIITGLVSLVQLLQKSGSTGSQAAEPKNTAQDSERGASVPIPGATPVMPSNMPTLAEQLLNDNVNSLKDQVAFLQRQGQTNKIANSQVIFGNVEQGATLNNICNSSNVVVNPPVVIEREVHRAPQRPPPAEPRPQPQVQPQSSIVIPAPMPEEHYFNGYGQYYGGTPSYGYGSSFYMNVNPSYGRYSYGAYSGPSYGYGGGRHYGRR